MMLPVDTNVLIDVLEDDPRWADWSIRQLRAQAQVHELAINPVIYAELSLAFTRYEGLERKARCRDRRIGPDTARGASTCAVPGRQGLCPLPQGRRQQDRRAARFSDRRACRRGAWPLLTRDAQRYRAYFPSVELVTPEPSP